MIERLREAGAPSPLPATTHDDAGLPPPIPGAPSVAADRLVDDLGTMAVPASALLEAGGDMPGWTRSVLQSIRPICVGALMLIPTAGACSVGLVALFDPSRALAMAQASTAFLAGIPADIVILIGALAGGYTIAKSVERLKNGTPT